MMKEEKELRGWVRASCKSEKIRDYHVLRLITALVRAVREDCIEGYLDWEDRPGGHTNRVTFPEAIRKNMRWHPIAIRRKGK
jgi:hypothetical protein